MDNINADAATFLGKSLNEGGQMTIANYGDCMLMAKLEGDDFNMESIWWRKGWHAFLMVYEGELRVTANGDRLGFNTSVYVDFIDGVEWEDIRLVGHFRACFVIMEQSFFMEATVSLRTRIAEMMMHYSQSPFVFFEGNKINGIHQLENVLFSTLTNQIGGIFQREILLSIICVWQYEMWNVFFHRNQVGQVKGTTYWKNAVSQFLYLAHTHCRERHEVGWYACQIGISPDALSSAIKRLYGKTASTVLNDLLLNEAKVCLRNPDLSIQDVADLLCFGDQSSFGKFFKRMCGVPPVIFRKKCWEE